MTGGSAHNKFCEAEVMSRYAIQQGIPPERVIVENRSRITVENALYCKQIINQYGWHDVVVVTSTYHAQRAAFIFAKFDVSCVIEAVDIPKGVGVCRKLFLIIWDKILFVKYYVLGDERFPQIAEK
jgi:uncharacterized SAM-binding protein YcdF (DUF218 family)